jgi:para-nitrobenzyl esterase
VILIAVLVTALLGGCARRDDSQTASSPRADPGLASGVVTTRTGVVQGLVAPGYRLFQGIPYAAAPVGEFRWRAPRPVPPWPGVRDATKPGPRCVQDTARDPDFGRATSEDCLSVNVWSPEGASGRPVMVWIHGGAFANGSADLYDAHWLVTKGDIVVVTVNYRLGAPGFLAHPALGAAGQVGNYGLADQQAALRWVRDNIAGFGGDPAKVTIAGESAGAMSVCDHLVAPDSAGLFRAAIIASGPCQAQADLATAQRESVAYAVNAGCPDAATAAACLRALPASGLAEPPWYFHIGGNGLTGPVVGPPVLPVDAVAAIDGGRAAKVPVLIGTTRDEFTLFVALQYLRSGQLPNAGDYPRELAVIFGGHTAAVEAHYPLDHYGGDAAVAYSAAVTDGFFSCVADRMADGLAGGGPVYAYEFVDRAAPAPEPLRRVPFPVGASHSLDLRYLFDIGGAPALDGAQRMLSDQMIGYWTQFVATGVPGYPGAPIWPQLNGHRADGPRMVFDAGGSRVANTFERDHQCSFWSTVDR